LRTPQPLTMADGWCLTYSCRSSSPQLIESDAYAANALARIICHTDASPAAFIEYYYQEALAIIERNKWVVLALAQALIGHHECTLNAAEIDAVIAWTLVRQALAAENARRAPAWRQLTERAAEITS
jgi:hypothetical protein